MKKTLIAAVMGAMMTTSVFSDSTAADNLPMVNESVKFADYAQSGQFVSAATLDQLLKESEDTIVIGVLDPKNQAEPIAGSHTLWRPDFSSAGETFEDIGQSMRNRPEEMAGLLGQLGTSEHSTIVVYARKDLHDAFRLYWQIKMLGHKDVRYLDGGLDVWVAAGLPTGPVNALPEKTDYTAQHVNTAQLATYEMVQNAVSNPDWVILDVRTAEEHAGAFTYPGAKEAGVIPNSQWIEWTEAQNEDGTLKPLKELEDTYGKVIGGKKVIVYCHTGVRAAHTAMVLSEVLGADDVHVYDGSWVEWSHLNSAQDQK